MCISVYRKYVGKGMNKPAIYLPSYQPWDQKQGLDIYCLLQRSWLRAKVVRNKSKSHLSSFQEKETIIFYFLLIYAHFWVVPFNILKDTSYLKWDTKSIAPSSNGCEITQTNISQLYRHQNIHHLARFRKLEGGIDPQFYYIHFMMYHARGRQYMY